MNIFRIDWTNNQGVDCFIETIDNAGDPGTVNIIPLKGTSIIKEVERTEDPFAPIKAQTLTYSFISTALANSATFSGGEDNRFYVRMQYTDPVLSIPINAFEGWMVQDDIQEPYKDPGQVITLVATDRLALLKYQEITAIGGGRPSGKYKITEWIAMALNQTGVGVAIRIIDNLFEVHHKDKSADVKNGPLFQTWVDAKTFQKNKDEMIDAFTVLQMILSARGARLTYYDSYWWIERIDEKKNGNESYVTYNMLGTGFAGESSNFAVFDRTFSKKINNKDGYVIRENLVKQRRPFKSVSVEFDYEDDPELICNADFSRGDFIANIPNETDPETGEPITVKSYQTQCWVYEKNVPPVAHPDKAYIKRLFKGGYETERYLHFPNTSTDQFYYLRCIDKIPMLVKDKFTLNLSVRYSTDGVAGGSGHFIMNQVWIRLYGDNGTFWNLQAVSGSGSADPSSFWKQATATWTTNQAFCRFEGDAATVDFRQWQQLTFEAAPLPVSGEIEILILNTQTPATHTKDVASLSMDYHALIAGSYDKFTGERYKVSQNGNYSAKRDDIVKIFDSPKKGFKGTMFIPTQGAAIFSDATNYFGSQPYGFSVPGNRTSDFTIGRVIIAKSGGLNDGIYTVVNSEYNGGTNRTTVFTQEATTLESNISTNFYASLWSLTSQWYDWNLLLPTPPPTVVELLNVFGNAVYTVPNGSVVYSAINPFIYSGSQNINANFIFTAVWDRTNNPTGDLFRIEIYINGAPAIQSNVIMNNTSLGNINFNQQYILHPGDKVEVYTYSNHGAYILHLYNPHFIIQSLSEIQENTNDRIGKWLAYALWNQYRKGARIFEFNMKGLFANVGRHHDLIHRYLFNYPSPHNYKREFILTYYRQDWKTCEWAALFVEVNNDDDSRSFADNFEFKYISDKV